MTHPTPDLATLKSLEAAATEGPWIQSGVRQKLGVEDCIMVGPDGWLIIALPIGKNPKEHAGAFRDAAFIVAMRNAFKGLIAELEELRRGR